MCDIILFLIDDVDDSSLVELRSSLTYDFLAVIVLVYLVLDSLSAGWLVISSRWNYFFMGTLRVPFFRVSTYLRDRLFLQNWLYAFLRRNRARSWHGLDAGWGVQRSHPGCVDWRRGLLAGGEHLSRFNWYWNRLLWLLVERRSYLALLPLIDSREAVQSNDSGSYCYKAGCLLRIPECGNAAVDSDRFWHRGAGLVSIPFLLWRIDNLLSGPENILSGILFVFDELFKFFHFLASNIFHRQ